MNGMRYGMLVAIASLLVTSSVVLAHVTAFSIDPSATVSDGGTLIEVTGNLTCTADEGYRIDVTAFQGKGPNQVIGEGSESNFFTICTGSSQSWETIIYAPSGKLWHNGRATVRAHILSCTLYNESNCAFEQPQHIDSRVIDRTIRLQ